jgi:hypothetical protein
MALQILHLVLYSPDKEYYIKMKEATQSLYRAFTNVTTVYYFKDPTITSPILEDCFKDEPEAKTNCKVLRLPGTETYIPGILKKTIEALRYFCNAKSNMTNFDFVVRSNASTVINFKVLLPLLEQRRDQLFYGGPLVIVSEKPPEIEEEFWPLWFVIGTCILLRQDAVGVLVQNEEKLHFGILDDPAIGLLFKQLGYLPKDGTRPANIQVGAQFAFFHKLQNVDQIVSFRHHRFHSDRLLDLSDVQGAVTALRERAQLTDEKPVVISILYHTLDITAKVLLLCKFAGGQITTDGNNTILDDFFGDPCPNQPKLLSLRFVGNSSFTTFSQKATLTFFLCKDDRTKMQVC